MENIIGTMIYIVPLLIISFFVGKYIYKVYKNEVTFLNKFETWIYKILNIEETKEMNSKKYFHSLLIFSIISIVILVLILMFQGLLPFNSEKKDGIDFSLALNTAISYVTNTNWQNYSGEEVLSNFSQMIGLTVQNFISASVGLAVLFSLFRGISSKEKKNIGNFWKDITRIILYILLPLSIISSVLLVSIGVMQNMKNYQQIEILQTGETQTIPMGPVASQVAIKQLGTNGGGFFGSNSAHPLENPTALSNYIESFLILLLPMSLVFTFGFIVKNKKQAYIILVAMLIFLLLCMFGAIYTENIGENYNGKEVRIGTMNSAIWSIFTTATSNGSVNSLLDTQNPIITTIQMLLMCIGEIIFGGIGSGLYTFLIFIVITVFIAGLMVGRTPEFLGKKIEPFEMKMAMLVILVTPVCILVTCSILCLLPNILSNTTQNRHFTELLYAAISTGANNGSALKGFNGNTFMLNIILSINMLVARFVPIYAILKISESLAKKKKIPKTIGTLDTTSGIFVILLIVIILIFGVLSFLPAFALGPIAEILEFRG